VEASRHLWPGIARGGLPRCQGICSSYCICTRFLAQFSQYLIWFPIRRPYPPTRFLYTCAMHIRRPVRTDCRVPVWSFPFLNLEPLPLPQHQVCFGSHAPISNMDCHSRLVKSLRSGLLRGRSTASSPGPIGCACRRDNGKICSTSATENMTLQKGRRHKKRHPRLPVVATSEVQGACP
jgi:hypothetical protein